jgi:hypothetical protein
MKNCFRCNQEIGKLENGEWLYYTKVVNYDVIDKEYHFVYLCRNCEILHVSWECIECKKETNDSTVEFCVQPQNELDFRKTCVPCLNKLREQIDTDLNCNCLICREINDNHIFIPK